MTSPNGGQNILDLGTSSAEDYMVCTELGNNICPLPKYIEFENRCNDSLYGNALTKEVKDIVNLIVDVPEKVGKIAKEIDKQNHSGGSFYALSWEVNNLLGEAGLDVLNEADKLTMDCYEFGIKVAKIGDADCNLGDALCSVKEGFLQQQVEHSSKIDATLSFKSSGIAEQAQQQEAELQQTQRENHDFVL